MKDDQLDKPERRQFLKGVVATGSATAFVALAGNAGAAESGATGTAQSGSDAKGYRVTRHIEDYYRTLRS